MRLKCKACNGLGMKTYTSCPLKEIDQHSLDLVELAEDAIAGAWPILVGRLDQSDSFAKCVSHVRHLKCLMKPEI